MTRKKYIAMLVMAVFSGMLLSCAGTRVASDSGAGSGPEIGVIELPSSPIRVLERVFDSLREEGAIIRSVRIVGSVAAPGTATGASATGNTAGDAVAAKHQMRLLARDFPKLSLVLIVGSGQESDAWQLHADAKVFAKMSGAGFPVETLPDHQAEYLTATTEIFSKLQVIHLRVPSAHRSAYRDPAEWKNYLVAGFRRLFE